MDDRYRIDSHKLHYHPERVAQWLAADTWDEARHVYPIYWEITTAAACNHRCTFCSVDAIGYPAILMDAKVLATRMNGAAVMGVKSVMFAGTGEPLLHKRIDDINIAAREAGLDTAFTTNGVLLDRLSTLPLASWVKVSLNAGTRDSYAAIHQTDAKDWDKVWGNIENAAARKGSCALGVQCVVLPENVDDMEDLARLARDSGADYLVLKPYSQSTFSIVQRGDIDYRNMLAFLAGLESYSTASFKVLPRVDALRQEAEAHHYDRCRATPNFWTYTMADGRMFACSAHLLDDRFCLGNINTQSFQEIWEGEERKRVWEMMHTFDIRQCRLNCRMDKPNRYLHELDGHQAHVNYI